MPKAVSRDEWLVARKELLAREKELTAAQARLHADRRRLPMVRIEKPYVFDGPDGPVPLIALFEGRRQLIMHHFMWTYDDKGAAKATPCASCASIADGIAGLTQLHVRNTSLAGVSRAPYPLIEGFRKRMNWTFPWYGTSDDFNYDFHVTLDDRVAEPVLNFRDRAELDAAGRPWSQDDRGEWPAISAFLRDGDDVFHTYSTLGRGIEPFVGGNRYLDLTALGRQEHWEEPAGRAAPLGLQAGGPAMRLPDEY